MARLLFGMDIGVISGALPLIKNAFAISNVMQEMIVSAMMAGAAVGAALGALACAAAYSPGAPVAARVLLGVAVGMSSYIAPSISRKSRRKRCADD